MWLQSTHLSGKMNLAVKINVTGLLLVLKIQFQFAIKRCLTARHIHTYFDNKMDKVESVIRHCFFLTVILPDTFVRWTSKRIMGGNGLTVKIVYLQES